jgi:putative transposase
MHEKVILFTVRFRYGSSRRVSCGHGIFLVVLYRGILHYDDMSSYSIHYKSNNNVVYPANTTWCGVRSTVVLVNGMGVRLKELLQSVFTESRADLFQLEVVPDHVHLLVEVDPQYSIHRLVRAIKGWSSWILRQEYPWLRSRLPTLWTNAYFVSTIGGAPLEVITQYIELQKRV